MSNVVDCLDVSIFPPGHQEIILLNVAPLADGSILQVPVRIAIGSKSGPTLAMIAGVHGDEPDGMIALLDFWSEVPKLELNGRLIIVPIANPTAFAAHQRLSPDDGVDLNRVFPGKVDGTVSEQLAHALYRLVVDNANFLFTLHSWYATGDCLPHIEFQDPGSKVRNQSSDAAAACGFSRLRAADWHRGLLPRVATDAGIPSIEAEIGGAGRARAESQVQYREHIMNLMKHLGLLPGPVVSKASSLVGRTVDITSPGGGILRSAVRLGDRVHVGDIIATVTDLSEERATAVQANCAGTVLAIRQYLSTSPGDILFRIFEDPSR